MQIVLTVLFCYVCYNVTAETTNTASAASILSAKTNLEEFTIPQQRFMESTKDKRDKFSCVLNLLKNALAEELQGSYYDTEDTAQDNASSIKSIVEETHALNNNENQLEKPILRDEYKADAKSNIQKDANLTNEQKNIEMPNMIPIFKPRPRIMNELNQNVVDFGYTSIRQGPPSKSIAFVPEKIIQTVMSPIPSQIESNLNAVDFSSKPITNSKKIQKSRAVSFVPEKIVQTNMSPILNQAMFNIPCQRAADVLDMSIVVPKETAHRNTRTNVNPIADVAKPIYPNQIPAPIECADEDDTIAMLFKPKNISLKQVYGNLMKKITITVLVPYHMSKLGTKKGS